METIALNILMALIAGLLLVWSIRSGSSQRGSVRKASWIVGRPPVPPMSMPTVKVPPKVKSTTEDLWDDLHRNLREDFIDTAKLLEKNAKAHYKRQLDEDLRNIEHLLEMDKKNKLKSDLTSLSANRINKKLEEQRRKILEGL